MNVRDPGVRVTSDAKPNHIMHGVDLPSGKVRLYASRNLHGKVGWASRDTGLAANVWHLDADMDHVLIIDGTSWGEVYARVFEIWENHDREDARVLAEGAKRAARQQELSRPVGQLTGPAYHYGDDDGRHSGHRSACIICNPPEKNIESFTTYYQEGTVVRSEVVPDEGPVVTKTGKVLTAADLEKLAAEAEIS